MSISGTIAAAATLYFTGGNVQAAAYAYGIGAGVDSYINPNKIDGPHLQDRSVQVSTYGNAIPVIFGGTRGAGNVIWSTDLVEHDVDAGGKGGPTVTTHSYTVSCAILIGEGPIKSVRRIWADATLVYDASEDASDAAKVASSAFKTYFTFYSGSEDQLPDPTIEEDKGVGKVSAYRGYCYIVFKDIPLANYGNRIPNFMFETGGEPGSATPDGITYEPLRINPWILGDSQPHHDGRNNYDYRGLVLDSPDAHIASFTAEYHNGTYLGFTANAYSGDINPLTPALSAFGMGATLGGGSGEDWGSAQYARGWYFYGRPDLVFYRIAEAGEPLYCITAAEAGLVAYDGKTVLSNAFDTNGVGGLGAVQNGTPGSESNPFPGGNITGNNCGGLIPGGDIYTALAVATPSSIQTERVPSPPPNKMGCQPGDPCVLEAPAQIPGNTNFCIDCDGNITPRVSITYEVVTGTFKQLAGVQYDSNKLLYQNALGPVLLPDSPDYNNAAFWSDQRANAIAAGKMREDTPYPVVVSSVAKGTATRLTTYTSLEANSDLETIVRSIDHRAGHTDDELDLSDLADIPVQGNTIANQMAARNAKAPLQQCYFFDVVESGTKLKAVRRGKAAVVTISADDMAATEGQDTPVAVVPNRAQESELPATVNVSYPVRIAGYEIGTQRERRLTTGSQQVETYQLPVVMTDQKGAEVASVMMYERWVNRTQRTWSTTRKYTYLEPTDVVTLDDGEFEYVVRIVEKSEEGGVIKWVGVDEDIASYSPVVSPVIGGIVPITVRFDGPTKLEVVDTASLRDTDADAPVTYLAASGYLPSWTSGAAYKSTDGGTTYALALSLTRKATIGYAQSVLGPWSYGNVVDETNTLTVKLHSGSLSSVTLDQFLAGKNMALVAGEIVYFRRATLIADKTYLLSGFLRGRKGTEDLQAHALKDRFILLDTNLYALKQTITDINLASEFKGVTSGQNLDTATPIDFTNTGRSLKPYSVAQLRAVQLANQDIRLDWNRRTRKTTRFGTSLGSSAPLGEAVEAYEVDVLSGTTVLRTLASSTPGITYTSAQQIADGVTAGSSLTFNAYQLSATVGRGTVASVSIGSLASAHAQVATVTLSGTFVAGFDRVRVTLDGTPFAYLVPSGYTLTSIAFNLATLITGYTKSASANVLTVSGAPSVPFTIAADILRQMTVNAFQHASLASAGSAKWIGLALNPDSAFPPHAGSVFTVRFVNGPQTSAGTGVDELTYTYTAYGWESAQQVASFLIGTTPTYVSSTGSPPAVTFGSSGGLPVAQFPVGQTAWTAGGSAGAGAWAFSILQSGSEVIPADRPQTVELQTGMPSFDPDPEAGDVYTINLAGAAFTHTVTPGETLTDVTAALTALIDADAGYSATVGTASTYQSIVIVGATVNVPFSYSGTYSHAYPSVTAAITQAAT